MSYNQKRRFETLERIQDVRRLSKKEQREYDKLYDLYEDEQELQMFR